MRRTLRTVAVLALGLALSAAAPPASEPQAGRIAEALAAARQLQGTGRYAEALDRLEPVFALEPDNAAAIRLRDRLLSARQRSERDHLIQDTLQTAGAHLAGGRFENAISAANRVLALDPGNPEALVMVRRAYAEISQGRPGMPGSGTLETTPAESTLQATRSADRRQEKDAELAERVESAGFRRTGVAIGFLGGGGASIALGAAGLLIYRRGRQQRRRARKFNPYIAGGPIFDEGLFYGREPLVQRILQTVHHNSLLLHGERRIGKTSLLHHVEKRLEALDDPEYVFHPVYIDLQGTPEDKFFATLADQIFETLQPSIREAGREPALARPGYSHHDLVRELHGLLKQLKARSERQVKLVLLIDEVDELNDYDPRVSQSLRSLFMKRFAENLAAVVAGVSIRKEWERETSPWYNFFEEIEVEALSPREAERLVLEPVRGMFRFEAGAAQRIVAMTGGKPFQIQRRCLALVQRLHEEGRRTVTLIDCEEHLP